MENTSQLEAVMSSLGYNTSNGYIKEPYCLENLREIIKFLREEEKSCNIRRSLGKANILSNDLIPILTTYDDPKLSEIVLRLLINLTQPAHNCFPDSVLLETEEKTNYLSVLWYLQEYKRSLSDIKLWSTVGIALGTLLEKSWFDRTINDRQNIERWLFLIRNALLIGNDSVLQQHKSNCKENDHGNLISCMHKSGLFDLILCLGQFDWVSDNRLQAFPHYVIEIVALLLKQQDPRAMAEEGQCNQQFLTQIMEEKKREKRLRDTRWSGRRHGGFGGVYVVPVGEKTVISRSQYDNITFDKNKQSRRGKRKPLTLSESTCRPTQPLKDFCLKFLTHCFPMLVGRLKDHWPTLSDERQTYWCWLISFFMTFSRLKNVGVEYVSDLLTADSLKHVCGFMSKHVDGINQSFRSVKQQVILCSSRLHLSLHVFRELFETVNKYSSDETLKGSMDVIKENMFYSAEYFDVLVSVFRKYSPAVMSRKLLCDLVETVDVYVSSFEEYLQFKMHYFVKSAKKRRRKTKKKCAKVDWETVEGGLVGMETTEYDGPAVFDPVGDADEDEQITNAKGMIRAYLLGGDHKQAVALLGHCQDLWPDSFGSKSEILSSLQSVVEGASDDRTDSEEEESEEEYVDREITSEEYINKLVSPVVISAYISLLEAYKQNDDSANKAVINMFRRISFKLDMPGYLFQLRLFRICQNIINEVHLTGTERYQDILDFVGGVFKLFTEKFSEFGPVLAVELLFWKNKRNAYNATHGKFSYESFGGRSKKTAWTEEEDYELRHLFLELRGNSETIVEDILAKLIRKDRTRRKIIKRLIHLDLIQSSADLKTSKNEDLFDWILHIYCDGGKSTIDDVLHVVSSRVIQTEEVESVVHLGDTADHITYKFLKYCGFRKCGETTFRLENEDTLQLSNVVEAVSDCQSRIIGWRTGQNRLDDDVVSVAAGTEADLSEDDRFLDEVLMLSSTRTLETGCISDVEL